jgi:hypothetical protein
LSNFIARLDPAIHRDAKKMDPRAKAAGVKALDRLHRKTQRVRPDCTKSTAIAFHDAKAPSSANLERLKIRHDPAAVLLYGNGRVG